MLSYKFMKLFSYLCSQSTLRINNISTQRVDNILTLYIEKEWE